MTRAAVRTLPARAEPIAAAAALATMAALPVLEILLRRTLKVGVPGSILIVQHLTLVVTFLGAALAARSDTLLALSTATFLPARWGSRVRSVAHLSGAGVAAALALASLAFVRAERGTGELLVLGIPRWLVLGVMPVGYGLVAAPPAQLPARTTGHRASSSCCGLILALGAATSLDVSGWSRLAAPLLVAVAGATALGLPLFASIGAVAMLLFLSSGMPAATVPVDTSALTGFPALPAVPLFTLAGAVLGAGRRASA